MAEPSQSPSRRRERGGARWLWFLAAALVGVPLSTLCGLALAGPPSGEALGFSLGVLVVTAAGLLAPWRRDASYAAGLGTLIALSVLGYRLLEAGGSATIRSYTGPSMTRGRLLDRLVPERDVAIGGSNILLALGRVREPGLIDALRDGYDRMRLREGPVPSSVVSTFVYGQTPRDHTVLRIAPNGRFEFDAPESVVLFLHGFMGNVTLACWQVAQGANAVGVEVVCPSTHWRADWASPDGRAIVEAHLARLRAAGVRRVYLAGLSAGAIGASRLARHLDLEGLILISGASRQAHPARVPTLVLQGARDTMTPPGAARAYARRAGRRARYVEVQEASHWLILSHHEVVTEAIRTWLAQREGLIELHGE